MSTKMNIVDKLHQEFVAKRIKGKEFERGPLVVELDPTELCNLSCPGCVSEDLICNRNSFSNERLLEIGQELYDIGTKAVVLIGGGEPLMHPAIGKFIEFLGTHDIAIGITTNGCFISKHQDVIAKYANWTRISVDAATAETFDRLRPSKDGKSKFEYIIKQMRELAKIKTGTLGFSFLIRTEADGFDIKPNINEIYDAALLARDIGCDYFEVKPSYSYIDEQDHALVKHSKERMEEAKIEVGRLKDLNSDTFKIITAINLEHSLNCVEQSQDKDYNFCPSAILRTLICPSGVYSCPYWRGKEPYRLGDAKATSISEIWHSDRRKMVMEFLDPVKRCSFHCLRNDTNREVVKMLGTDEKDINIVAEYDRFI